MNTFWSWFVAIVTLAHLVGYWVLIRWTAKPRPGEAPVGELTGHTYDDGRLAELNNPMPRWWLWMFYLTIIFGLIYLTLYPGLGNFPGLLGWSQEGQYQDERARAEERFGPIFARFAERDIEALSQDPEALRIGQRLFSNYCAQCHGSDARGGIGFPNLTDGEWNWGGQPEQIRTTILNGRQAAMPTLGAAIGDEQAIDQVVQYVMSLSGAVAPPPDDVGRTKFEQVCAACHMADGTGNPALGAPDLTNDSWLYGGSRGAIRHTIVNGRNGVMPAFGEFLGEDRVHLLAAYVYSLSRNDQ